jgi:hypothetical protein
MKRWMILVVLLWAAFPPAIPARAAGLYFDLPNPAIYLPLILR